MNQEVSTTEDATKKGGTPDIVHGSAGHGGAGQGRALDGSSADPSVSGGKNYSKRQIWLRVAFFTWLLLLSVALVGGGFKMAAGDQASELFSFAKNPIAGLMIGLLATALVQSSSTVSSITVGLVAGGLPVGTAIPIIMGANMGTTITNTLVSLGHIRQDGEFKRAFAAATVHDFFNMMAIAVFFPLEVLFHPLQNAAGSVAHVFASDVAGGGGKFFNPLKATTKPVVKLLQHTLEPLMGSVPGGVLLALLGVGMILLAISKLGKVLRAVMVGKAKHIMHSAIGRGPLRGIFSGTMVTIAVQSSSTTTSLIVPFVGSGVFTVRQVYPFILGANIGTCITALLAALGVAEHQEWALQIALVHLFFNISGIVVLYGLPGVRELPLKFASALAEGATRSKIWVGAYIVGLFFILPTLAFLL